MALFLAGILPGLYIRLLRPETQLEAAQTAPITFETTLATQPDAYTLPVKTAQGVVNMELEQYIVCVVLREMPAYFETEALKAQAVVARTYTLRADEKRSKHPDAAVCTSPSCCQGFCTEEEFLSSGGTREELDKVRAAVEATQGTVIVYAGQLIEAVYFSCSGGMTEDAVAVWGSDVPYLKATHSPGEESANHFTDTVTIPLEAFYQKLGLRKDMVFSLGSMSYTPGGGVERISICGKEFTGTQLRGLLQLRSTVFTLTVAGDKVIITTKGYGHRVGMSQYGAEAMAVQGKTYAEILAHYYTGIELSVH